jgi:2'-5' RNA ligase
MIIDYEALKSDIRARLASIKSEYKYSSVMVNMPKDIAEKALKVADIVDEKDLHEQGKEDAPHVTVRYGLKTKDPDKVAELVKDHPPVEMTIGKLNHFSNEGQDVLYHEVTSPHLTGLNSKLVSNVKSAPIGAKYTPHMTVAFLKPGKGKKYSGKGTSLTGKKVIINSIKFSDPDGAITTIPLAGNKA